MTTPSTRSLQRKAGAVLLTLLLATSALLALSMPSMAAQKTQSFYPTVSDERRVLDSADLTVGGTRISGLRTITVTSDYTATADSEFLACEGKFRYSFDGSTSPAVSTRVANMNCVTTPAIPQKSHGYQVVLPTSTWAQAPADALVSFRIEIDRPNMAAYIDDNGGAFYKFRLDKSRGGFLSTVPSIPTGSSTTEAATQDDKPPINFILEDVATEAPIQTSSIGINVNGQNRTTQFDCSFPAQHRMQCSFDYAKAGANFAFAHNQSHTVIVTGFDTVGNTFDPARSTLRFRVDRAAPLVTEVSGTPQQFTPGADNLPVTSRGVNVTVRAKVEDPTVNTNSKQHIFAQLYNTTRGLASPIQPMEFNTTSSRWQTFNMTIPSSWPAEEFRVHVRVFAVDLAGNTGVGNTTKEAFILDPVAPLIVDVPVTAFQKDTAVKIRASVKDLGSGVDPNSVILHYSNQTGGFKTAPPASQRIDLTNYEIKMTREGTTDNYSADIPAAQNGAMISYFVKAKDRAGGQTQAPTRTYSVDLVGPVISEPSPAAFRGASPYVFTFSITDAGAGVNQSTATLFFGTGTSFASRVLNNTGGNVYTTSINLTVADGVRLQYYVEALDALGNKGNLSSATTPRESQIDLVAPSFNISSPANASASTFTVAWNATDTGSGVQSFTIQARVLGADGTPSVWVTILNQTTVTSLDFCGEGERNYQFRGFAIDRVGNAGSPPSTHQAQTVLSGTGCAEGVSVQLTAPSAGAIVSGAASKTYEVRYLASSTRSFTPAVSLVVTIEFSPDGGAHWFTIANRVPNTGIYAWDLNTVPNCGDCRLRLTAYSLSGAQGSFTSAAFQIRGASTRVDLDGNGLPDSWELTYSSSLGTLLPDDDLDGDGLTNLEESSYGTNPESRDTDGDGVHDRLEVNSGTDPTSALSTPTRVQARSQQFTNWYWSVPVLFGACVLVFFAGLARRW